jgi:nitrite reductase/ring-hydroxylating ferredoxin subunit
MKFLLSLLALISNICFSNGLASSFMRRSTLVMKRGRGLGELSDDNLGPKIKSKKSSPLSSKGISQVPARVTWIPIPGMTSGMNDIPMQEGTINLIDTMLPALTKPATNPTGAVAVVKYKSSVYCTNVQCPSCQFPLNKAEILEPTEETSNDPRIACSFCRATYNLRTGDRVTTHKDGGVLSGIARNLFSKQKEDPLPVYALGEKNGQVMINLGK